MAANATKGDLARCVTEFQESNEEGLTSAQLAKAYKAALSDFVCGKTNRKSVAEVNRLLSGALAVRRQLLAERDGLNTNRCHSFYPDGKDQ